MIFKKTSPAAALADAADETKLPAPEIAGLPADAVAALRASNDKWAREQQPGFKAS